jgi:hypothetical protein
VDLLADAIFSEKRAVSVFRVEVFTSALKMETARFSETLESTNKSTRRLNPKLHNQNCHSRENLKSQLVLMNSCPQTSVSSCYFAVKIAGPLFSYNLFSV